MAIKATVTVAEPPKTPGRVNENRIELAKLLSALPSGKSLRVEPDADMSARSVKSMVRLIEKDTGAEFDVWYEGTTENPGAVLIRQKGTEAAQEPAKAGNKR